MVGFWGGRAATRARSVVGGAAPVRLGHWPALDGLRGLGALLVTAAHLGQWLWPDVSGWLLFPGGAVGVDLFFALSGFLITTLLLAEFDRIRRVRFGTFLWRRVLRLSPTLVVVVATVLAGAAGCWGIFRRSLRYMPLTLPTLASLVPDDVPVDLTCVDEGIADVDPGAEADLFARRDQAREHFHGALQALNGATPIPYATFRELCERHLPVFGQTDSVARVAYNLALDYEAEHGESLCTRGETLARLALGYLNVVQELRAKPRHELNLPFLFATSEGPKHYARSLDVATIVALSERDPAQRTGAARSVSSDRASGQGDTLRPEPKRGFWSKLFG